MEKLQRKGKQKKNTPARAGVFFSAFIVGKEQKKNLFHPLYLFNLWFFSINIGSSLNHIFKCDKFYYIIKVCVQNSMDVPTPNDRLGLNKANNREGRKTI